ncbi:MAG: hypothetical protein HYV90_00395 [Candidatus Woesebacteria bacterium]|nr:MAG: hypothetical protein HYV90_00395 [Candidatus Woesebacteria bacterium]
MFKSVHIKAMFVWLVYSIITKGSFLTGSLRSGGILISYLLNIILSIFFGWMFLYFFSHEDFFKFAKEIENKNVKKEKQWERKLLHHGKLVTSFLIGVATGPLIGALAVRFLLPRFKYKYLVISFSSALGSALWLGVARGVIHI